MIGNEQRALVQVTAARSSTDTETAIMHEGAVSNQLDGQLHIEEWTSLYGPTGHWGMLRAQISALATCAHYCA